MGFFSRHKDHLCRRPADFLLSTFFLSLLCSATQAAPQDTDMNAQVSSQAKLPISGLHTAAFQKPYGYHLSPILDHIHANPAQREKITEIVSGYRSKIEPLRIIYKQKSQDFLSAVTKGLPSDLILSQQMQLGQLYSDINSQYCLMSLAVRRLLKPDQIVLYEEYRKTQGWVRK